MSQQKSELRLTRLPVIFNDRMELQNLPSMSRISEEASPHQTASASSAQCLEKPAVASDCSEKHISPTPAVASDSSSSSKMSHQNDSVNNTTTMTISNKVFSNGTNDVVVESIPWTQDDQDLLKQQVAFWKNYLVDHDDDDEHSISKDGIRDLLRLLYTALRRDYTKIVITRSDHLLQTISQTLHQKVQAVNLVRLQELLDAQQRAGEIMGGQDVLLLTGAVGSGKTTTLHFLADTEFHEAEIDGFEILQPSRIRDPRIKSFQMSLNGLDATTKVLQAAPVMARFGTNREELIVICDVPGAGSASTVEEEIAYFFGMGIAIERAKRIKPVVVFNEELVGSCFGKLSDAFQQLKREMSIKSFKDFKPLDYVFTHYEERHRTRIHLQLKSLIANGGIQYNRCDDEDDNDDNDDRNAALFEDFVDDIVRKTAPQAKLAMPLTDDPQQLLGDLWNGSFVEEPEGKYYQQPPPDAALKQLQLQFEITLEEFKLALSREAYREAADCIESLAKLATWVPHARKAMEAANIAAAGHLRAMYDWMSEAVKRIDYEQVLYRMEQYGQVEAYLIDSRDCFHHGQELIWESLITPMEEENYRVAMSRVEILCNLSNRFKQAAQCVKRALKLLCKWSDCSIDAGYFQDATSLLKTMANMGNDIPEANACAKSILAGLKECLETTITIKKDYFAASNLICSLNELALLYPQCREMVETGMRSCSLILESSAAQDDYTSTLSLIGGMHHIADTIPKANEIAEEGTKILKTTLKRLIGKSNLQPTFEILNAAHTLAVPDKGAFADLLEYGYEALDAKLTTAVEARDYETVIQLLEYLSQEEDTLPRAKECARIGSDLLRMQTAKALSKKNFSLVLDVIQEFGIRGQKNSAVAECSRYGLDLLSKAAQRALSERDYKSSIEIVTYLTEVTEVHPKAIEIAQLNMQTMAQHITELRQSVEATVSEVLASVDLKVFVAMLLKLKSQIEKVDRAEPVRKFLLAMKFRAHEEEDKQDVKEEANLLASKLYTSQTFCGDQIGLLSVYVREQTPNIDVENVCMDSLIRNRKALLSTMIRLKAINKILQNCPGGEKAAAIYTESFDKFHSLLETILEVAEESIKPPINMRLFELEAWFLSALIKGFIRDKLDTDSDERKQMVELECRRRLLMLQFDVKITEAVENLTEQDFLITRADKDVLMENEDLKQKSDEDNSVVASSGSSCNLKSDRAPVVTMESIEKLDLLDLEHQRETLLSLSKRAELSRMITKQPKTTDYIGIVQNFDQSLIAYILLLVHFVDEQYDGLLEFAKTGAAVPVILDRANELQAAAVKIEEQIGIAKTWSEEFQSTAIDLACKRLIIFKKKIELAKEKLEDAIKAGNDIGFMAFVTTITKPFICNGKWHENIPESIV